VTGIGYADSSIHFPNSDIFVGDDNTALLLHLCKIEGEVVNFFCACWSEAIFQAFIKKFLEK